MLRLYIYLKRLYCFTHFSPARNILMDHTWVIGSTCHLLLIKDMNDVLHTVIFHTVSFTAATGSSGTSGGRPCSKIKQRNILESFMKVQQNQELLFWPSGPAMKSKSGGLSFYFGHTGETMRTVMSLKQGCNTMRSLKSGSRSFCQDLGFFSSTYLFTFLCLSPSSHYNLEDKCVLC